MQEYVPLVGGLFYALGWAAATRFYGHFDVAPEEVGIDFGYILVRVSLILAALLLIAYVIWVVRVRLKESFALSAKAARRIHNTWLLLSIIFVVAVFARSGAWAGRANWIHAAIATILHILALFLVLVVLVGPVGNAMGYDRHTKSYSPKALSVGWLSFVGVALVIVILIVPFVMAERAATAVRDGEPYTIYAAPWLRGITVQAVSVDFDSPMPGAGRHGSECMLLLGTGGSFVVLYDLRSESVYRISPERVELASGC